MKNMPAYNFVVQPERRICTVGRENPRTGYFHCWEHFSKPVPAGVINGVFGIVEMTDGVHRVDPTDIKFCDEEHAALCAWNKYGKEHCKNEEK